MLWKYTDVIVSKLTSRCGIVLLILNVWGKEKVKKAIALLVLLGIAYHFSIGSSTTAGYLLELPEVEKDNRSGVENIDGPHRKGFDVSGLAEPGLITIIQFYEKGCEACPAIDNYVNKLMETRPDVALRRIEIPNNIWSTSLEKIYGIYFKKTVTFVVYDREGNLLATDGGDTKNGKDNEKASILIWDWAKAEVARSGKQKYYDFRTKWNEVNPPVG